MCLTCHQQRAMCVQHCICGGYRLFDISSATGNVRPAMFLWWVKSCVPGVEAPWACQSHSMPATVVQSLRCETEIQTIECVYSACSSLNGCHLFSVCIAPTPQTTRDIGRVMPHTTHDMGRARSEGSKRGFCPHKPIDARREMQVPTVTKTDIRKCTNNFTTLA